MTEREHGIITRVSLAGTCPYCGRPGLSKKYGAQGKHMRACGRKTSLLDKEKKFAEWIAAQDATESPDMEGEPDFDALYEQHLHDKAVAREDAMGVPENQR